MTSLFNYFSKLAADGQKAFIPYFVAGYPDLATTGLLLKAAARAGAHAIELGVPFSDPVADGPILQKANFESLKKGTTLSQILDLLSEITPEIIPPVLLMGYTNPFLQYGWKKLAQASKKAGAAGFIIADLPLEEGKNVKAILDEFDLGLNPLCAPTTATNRMAQIGALCSGFVYLVAVKGVTGARDSLSSRLIPFIKRARKKINKPLCVGFGISKPEQAELILQEADGIILGSRIATFLEEHQGASDLDRLLENFLAPWIKAAQCCA